MKIFAAGNDLQFLAQSNHWFADGTFRVTPDGFIQMYTIHGFYDDQEFPCVYALLPGRGEDTYRRLQTLLETLTNLTEPASIVTDFELAAIKAFQHHFPKVKMSGCLFHFGQCVWRQLQAD